MVSFTELCNADLVVHTVAKHGASIGLKLLRTGALAHGSFSAEHLCNVAQAAVRPTAKGPSQTEEAIESSWAELKLLGMPQDSADEVLAQLLPLARAASLLPVAASRNFLATSALLVEQGGDLHHVEVRRGRRRGLVDMAARAACLDGDWRLVLWLLGSGAKTEAPKGLLYLCLRQGKVALARELVRLGVRPDTNGLASLLCDVRTHGATEAAAFLIEELGVSANAQTMCNGSWPKRVACQPSWTPPLASAQCPSVAANHGGLVRKSAAEALGLLLPKGAGKEVEPPMCRAGCNRYLRPGWITCR